MKAFGMALLFVVAASILYFTAPREAYAGESTYLGSILADAGSNNNRTTLTPFAIGGAGTKISIQTLDAGAWVSTSNGRVNDRQGIWLPAGAAIVTSIDWNAQDAGSYRQGLVACRPENGVAVTECIINRSFGP